MLPPRDCQAKYDAQIRADIAALMDPSNPNGWPKLFSTIKQAAPNAEIVVLGYPAHLVVPGSVKAVFCLQDGFITASDRDWLNRMGDLLETDLSQTAKAAGVDYISVADLFKGHELCSGDSWFTGIGDPNQNDTQAGLDSFVQASPPSAQQEWFHPNVTGYRQEANLLAGYLPVP